MKEHTNHATSSQAPITKRNAHPSERKKKRFKFFAFWLRERKYLSTICYQEIRENIFTDEMNDNPRYTTIHTPVS